jgi:hypothetical protein
MWKRIAPGLSIERQEALKNRIEPILFPTRRRDKKEREIGQHERNQLWRLLGHLERLPVAEKERIGWWIAKAPPSYGVDSVALHALGRMGAAQLAYAPDSAMVPQSVANGWAEHLLKKAIPGNSISTRHCAKLVEKPAIAWFRSMICCARAFSMFSKRRCAKKLLFSHCSRLRDSKTANLPKLSAKHCRQVLSGSRTAEALRLISQKSAQTVPCP